MKLPQIWHLKPCSSFTRLASAVSRNTRYVVISGRAGGSAMSDAIGVAGAAGTLSIFAGGTVAAAELKANGAQSNSFDRRICSVHHARSFVLFSNSRKYSSPGLSLPQSMMSPVIPGAHLAFTQSASEFSP
jgi:hypothetical protein